MSSSSTILITVDLEDWFQVENLRRHFPHSSWENCKSRLKEPVHALLDLFDKYSIKCTFFVLGWLAERHSELVREISSSGHEIASHGYYHKLCTDVSPEELRKDLRKSRHLLQDMTGQPVSGYRAPSFSLTSDLIDLLAETGYTYDSSYNSFSMNSRYGRLEGSWSKTSSGFLQAANRLYEIPISNLDIAGKVFPWGGGGYFRLCPSFIFSKGVESIISRQSYYMFYCHPWEFDPGQPIVKDLRPDFRFRHYVNIAGNLKKLDAFLNKFSEYNFKTCSEFIAC